MANPYWNQPRSNPEFQTINLYEYIGPNSSDTVPDHGAFDDALSAIARSGVTTNGIEIGPGTYRVARDTTIPSTVTLIFQPGAIISVSSGYTFTINGPIQGQPVFTGSGSVVFGTKVAEVYPQWWGAKGDVQHAEDGVMSAGSATLTSQDATFTADDVGKRISVWAAGTASISLNTTIATFVSAHEVTLTAAAAATFREPWVPFYWGTDDYTAFNTMSTHLSLATPPPKVHLGGSKYGLNTRWDLDTGLSLTLEGESWERTELVNFNSLTFLGQDTYNPHLTVRHVTFVNIGPGWTGQGTSVSWRDVDGNDSITFDDCRFIGDVNTMLIRSVQTAHFTNCRFTPMTSGLCQIDCSGADGTSAADRMTITGNVFDRMGIGRSVFDGVSTISSAIVTSATAAFTSADSGMEVEVEGAGTSGSTETLYTTISSVDSATQITLATNALSSGTGRKLRIWTPRVNILANARTVTDGAITTGTNDLTSATAAFTSNDDGRWIEIADARGAGKSLMGIIDYVSATQIAILNSNGTDANASASVSGKTVYIGDRNPYMVGQAAINLEASYGTIADNRIMGFTEMGILLEGPTREGYEVYDNYIAPTIGWPLLDNHTNTSGNITGIFCKGKQNFHIHDNTLQGNSTAAAGTVDTKSIAILMATLDGTVSGGDKFICHDNTIDGWYEGFKYGQAQSGDSFGTWMFHHNIVKNVGLNFVDVALTVPTATGVVGFIKNNIFAMDTPSSAVKCFLGVGAGAYIYFEDNHFKGVTTSACVDVSGEATGVLIAGGNESDSGNDIFNTGNTANIGLDAPFLGEVFAKDVFEARTALIDLSGSATDEVIAQVDSRNNYLFLGATVIYPEAASTDAGVQFTITAEAVGSATTLLQKTTEVSPTVTGNYYAKEYYIKDNLGSVDIPAGATCIRVVCAGLKVGAGTIIIVVRYMRN